MSRATDSASPSAPSPWRAWFVLVGFAMRRHFRVKQLVGISVALLIIAAAAIGVFTQITGWDLGDRPVRNRFPTYGEYIGAMQAVYFVGPGPIGVHGLQDGVIGSVSAWLRYSDFPIFSRWVVFAIFLGFLMPLWTLSFATSALGSERESRSLVWQLTRPLPRWSIYVAQFVGVLPWCIGLNLIGLAVICSAAGPVGQEAFRAYWPAIFGGTLAFTALFHLIGAIFRRPAVFALLYAFFFETLAGDLPWTLKRLSVSFYTRCLMFHEAESRGFTPERREVFLPVSELTAWAALIRHDRSNRRRRVVVRTF